MNTNNETIVNYTAEEFEEATWINGKIDELEEIVQETFGAVQEKSIHYFKGSPEVIEFSLRKYGIENVTVNYFPYKRAVDLRIDVTPPFFTARLSDVYGTIGATLGALEKDGFMQNRYRDDTYENEVISFNAFTETPADMKRLFGTLKNVAEAQAAYRK